MISLLFKIKSILTLVDWLKRIFAGKPDVRTSSDTQASYKAELEELRATYHFTVNQFHSQIATLTEFYQKADRDRCELATKLSEVESKLSQKISGERSEQVRMGLLSENLAPLLKDFPYNSKGLRGLFNPIDFIHFGEDQITFVEVKTGDSVLSEKQRNIKKLIESGKVKFEIHRLNEQGYSIK